jgi:hypothetical protein
MGATNQLLLGKELVGFYFSHAEVYGSAQNYYSKLAYGVYLKPCSTGQLVQLARKLPLKGSFLSGHGNIRTVSASGYQGNGLRVNGMADEVIVAGIKPVRGAGP